MEQVTVADAQAIRFLAVLTYGEASALATREIREILNEERED